MNKYKLVIFDLDGTLADTSQGIYNCHRYANFKMRGNLLTDDKLCGVIGGPLLKLYTERFGYSEADAKLAISMYRERYTVEGIKGTSLYPDMEDVLEQLKNNGYLIAVATLKSEKLAKTLLDELGVSKYFDLIHGIDDNDTLTKAALIKMCMQELKCDSQNSVLIGDSLHDAKGAIESGVDFIAVTYGFGFKHDERIEYPHIATFGAVGELKEFFKV